LKPSSLNKISEMAKEARLCVLMQQVFVECGVEVDFMHCNRVM